jgi:hypothetical protein
LAVFIRKLAVFIRKLSEDGSIMLNVLYGKGFEAAQYYAAKAYVGQLNQGEPYSNLKEIIFIATPSIDHF